MYGNLSELLLLRMKITLVFSMLCFCSLYCALSNQGFSTSDWQSLSVIWRGILIKDAQKRYEHLFLSRKATGSCRISRGSIPNLKTKLQLREIILRQEQRRL